MPAAPEPASSAVDPPVDPVTADAVVDPVTVDPVTVDPAVDATADLGAGPSGGGRRPLPSSVALVVGVLLVSSLPVAYLSGRIRLGVVSDADHLMLAELLPSLASGTGLDEWTIPLANYAIPDWPLYAVALLVGPDPTATIAVFMALQLAVVGAAIHAVARVLDARSAPVVAIMSLGILVAFAANDVLPLTYLGAASTHTGTLALSLFALATTLRWLIVDEGRAGRALLFGGGLAFLAVASDRLFVVWFLCPAATALGVCAVLRRLPWAALGRWLAVNGVAAVVALPVPGLLFPNPTPYSVSVRQGSFRFGLGEYVRSVEATLAASSIQTISVVAASVVLAWCLLRSRTLAGAPLPGPTAPFLLAHLGAVVIWVSIGVASIGDGIAPHVRHYVILFVVPLSLGPVVALSGLRPVVATRAADRWGLAHPAVVLLIVPGLATVGIAGASLGQVEGDRATVPIDCIERAATRFGSRHGFASYWDARPIEVFSDRRLEVATMSPVLVDDPTNTDLSQFDSTYDFAVTSTHIPAWTLPYDRIVRLAGPPRSEETCGSFTIGNWGPDGLDLHPLDEVGAVLTLSGCDLPSQLADPDPTCVLTAGPEPAPGFLSYGPYVDLSAGRYRFSFRVRSDADPAVAVAHWDVIFDGATTDPVGRGGVPGSSGRWRPLEVDVEVPTGEGRTTVEVRLDPTGPLELSTLTVERLP